MAKPRNNSPTVISYAQALLDLATEQGQQEAIGQELHSLRQLLDENPAFGEFAPTRTFKGHAGTKAEKSSKPAR